MNDPRRNLPSASAFARYAACPGAFGLEREMRSRGELSIDNPSPESLSGTKIHKLLAGEEVLLDTDETEVFNRCRELEAELIGNVFGGIDEPTIERHKRYWLYDPRNLEALFSGEVDCVARIDNQFLIIDYKTGWNGATAAVSNWQLRALVALIAAYFGFEPPPDITAALIAPRSKTPVQKVEYIGQDIFDAYNACIDLARLILRDDQPRIPSVAACNFCPVRDVCPEGRFFVANMSMLTIAERHGEVLTGPQMSWLLERCELVERIVPAIRARAKRMLEEDANSIDGWRLRPGVVRQKITDVATICARAAGMGIGAVKFTEACSMTKTDLRELARNELEVKGRELEATVQVLIQGCVEEKQIAPTLERTAPTLGKG